VKDGMKESPYQKVLSSNDDIAIRTDAYTFLNGKK
jgi:hypothetical protein